MMKKSNPPALLAGAAAAIQATTAINKKSLKEPFQGRNKTVAAEQRQPTVTLKNPIKSHRKHQTGSVLKPSAPNHHQTVKNIRLLMYIDTDECEPISLHGKLTAENHYRSGGGNFFCKIVIFFRPAALAYFKFEELGAPELPDLLNRETYPWARYDSPRNHSPPIPARKPEFGQPRKRYARPDRAAAGQ